MAGVVHDVQNSEKIGEAQYEEFLEKLLLSDEEAFPAPNKRQFRKILSHKSASNSHDAAPGNNEKKMSIMQLL